MKYKNEIEIQLPRQKVVDLFDSTENLSKWQPELIKFETISGESGTVGAKSRLLYQMGKREVEMMETITEKELPNTFNGTYEAKGVYNIVANRFEETGPGSTKWISENEFQFSGFMKLMAWFMPGAFKKQSFKYMQQFKEFAENTGTVS